MESIFTEISLVIAIAAVIALIMRLLKQPMIIGHILTGILVGPSLLHIIHNEEVFEIFSSIGITLLLFIIGMGLNPKVIKEVGKVSVLTGVGQVIATTVVGILLVLAANFADKNEAIFIGVAMAFSSTIIILKLLSDKKEQNRLHGKISIGVLLVQDILATLALLFLSASDDGGLSILDLMFLIVKGGWLVIVLLLLSSYALPRAGKIIAGSQEFLFLFALSWGFGIATLFELAGFSIEVGALFAGVTLASLPYAQEMSARLRPLRDFFIVVFFINLGAGLYLDNILTVLLPAVALSLTVIIVNPVVIMVILGLLGYTKRTSFQVGIAMAQISEFSLIFLVLAERQGFVSEDVLATMTIVGILTIAASTYMILYTDKLFILSEKYLKLFERRHPVKEGRVRGKHDMILFGYRRGGHEFVNAFKKLKKPFVIVDYDPEVIDELEHSDLNFVYGDVNDIEMLDEIGIDHTRLVVSAISDFETNLFLLKHTLAVNPKVMVVVQAESNDDATTLYEAGASYVMVPHQLGSEKISSFIKKNGFAKSEFKKFREAHQNKL